MAIPDRHSTAEERLRATIADIDRRAAEREAWWAELDAQRARDAAKRHRQFHIELWIIAGLIIMLMALWTAMIIAVLS